MRYTLIGSPRSPYVRICRLLLAQHGLDYEFRILNFVDKPEDAEVLAKETPINRVPILLDGEHKIFDSRVIVNYLSRKHAWRALTWEEENFVSAIYATMEAGVTLFLLKRDGFDIDADGFFLSRQRNRIPDSLDYVKTWAEKLEPKKDWAYPAISLFCALYWLNKRSLVRLGDYPALADFQERFASMPGVGDTGF